MHITITEKKDNPFLKRVELKGNLVFEGATPSNAQVGEALAKELKAASTELVVMKHIYTRFSHQEAEFTAVAYYTPEAKKLTEKLPKKKKGVPGAESEEKKEGAK